MQNHEKEKDNKTPGEDLSREKLQDVLYYKDVVKDPKQFIHDFVGTFDPDDIREALWGFVMLAIESQEIENSTILWRQTLFFTCDQLCKLALAVNLLYDFKTVKP